MARLRELVRCPHFLQLLVVTVYSSYSREVHTGKPGFTACSISNVHMDK